MGKRRLLTLIALLLTLACSSCRQRIEGYGVKLDLDLRDLPNGLRVIMVEDHSVPVVSYQTWYKVGSVDEQTGVTGISHLFEHLMFKGTQRFGAKQFFEQLEAKGADVNAYTARDFTVYHETLTPDLLPKVIDMEADRMANLHVTDEMLQTERQVVLEERRLQLDNSPSGRIQEALWALAYRIHPYRWPITGMVQDLMGLTPEKLNNWFHKYYQPGNATIVIVGDFETPKTFELIKKIYGIIPAGIRPPREIEAEPEQKEERRFVIHDRVASERFAQAYHVPAADNDDSYAIDVLANILFEGASSRAYRRLVEEKDIAVSVSGSAYTPTYPGLFIVSVLMKGNLPGPQAESELDNVIREVQENGVTDEEIRTAVKQLTVQLVDSVRTPHGLAHFIGTVTAILGDPLRFSEDLSKYLHVTAADVKRVARKYMIANNRSIVTLSPSRLGGSR